MKDIQTPHELIDRLARRGDPVAFHTLLAGHIGASYRQLRDHGRSDTEALDELRPFLHEIYREFLDHPPTLPTEEWYAAHAARRLGTQGPASAEEVSLDALMTRETAPPHDAFGLEIQRAHSAWSRQRKRRSTIPRPIRHRPNRMVLTGLALVALLVGGAYAWLMLTHTTLSVSLIGASGTSRQILLPLGARPAPLPPNSPPSGGGKIRRLWRRPIRAG